MFSVTSKLAILALGVMTLTACTDPNTVSGDGYGTQTTTGPLIGSSLVGLPPEMQACSAGLAAPGCDKQAAGVALAQMSDDPQVLSNFQSDAAGRLMMRFTADGLRYGTDVVSCQDIFNQPGAFDASVRPGAAEDLGMFIKTISVDQARMKGCS